MYLYMNYNCMCLHMYEPLLISIINSSSQVVLEPLLIILDYQQRHTCSVSETVSDDNYEPLQMTFSIVVK
jgi:hypothetical protein